MAKTVNRKVGRPKGSVARYPGIMPFCRHYGYSHQHVREVLDGRRYSGRVRSLWAKWGAS
jgi:hypothetical protein